MQVIICEDQELCLSKYMDRIMDDRYSICALNDGAKTLINLLDENRIAEGCVVIWGIFSQSRVLECVRTMDIFRKSRADVRFIVCIATLKHLDALFAAEPYYMFSIPVNIKSICEVLENCYQNLLADDKDYITIQRKGHINCLNVSEISYVESSGRCLEIIMRNGDRVRIYMQMKDLQLKLPDFFVRCHQSYCVNMRQVKAYDCGKLLMYGEKVIPISKRYRQETKALFEKYVQN